MSTRSRRQSKTDQATSLATDNLVGGVGGAVMDMIQNGNEYARMMTAGQSPIAASPIVDELGYLGQSSKMKAGAVAGGFGLSGLGVLGGTMQGVQGVEELADGNLEDGLLNTAAGAGSFVSGATGMFASAGNGLAIGGTGAAGLGTAVGAAGAAPIAATVGGGLAAGITVGQRSNSYIADTGLLGQNNDGSGRSWSDWAADAGADTYANARENGDSENWAMAKGLGVTGAASVAAVPGAAVTGVAGLATDLYDFVMD